MAVRDALIAAIQGIVGDEVHVIPFEDNKDVLDRLTIVVRQRTITRLPEAPDGALRIDYVLGVTSAATDPTVAEPELDDFVPSFLADLRAHRGWLGWDTATKVLDGQNLSYDVEMFVLAGPTGQEM